jgi:hypothetical protein
MEHRIEHKVTMSGGRRTLPRLAFLAIMGTMSRNLNTVSKGQGASENTGRGFDVIVYSQAFFRRSQG